MKKEMLIIVVSFLILLPCMGLAGLLPDTGQTKCYDNTQEITCPQPGEPFYGQDAQYPCNPHSYTKLDACGNSLDAGAPFWAMVHDNITGLIWEAKTDDWSIHDRDNSYTWYDAQDFFITALNFAHFGGYSDWRLPTVKELSFLVDRDWHDPAIIEVNYFYNTMLSAYWSSTTYAGNPDFEAWYVNFGYGNVDYDVKSSDIWCNYVRAVRGGQTSNSFIDNGDGTVTDTSTGLMWEQNGSTIGTWQDAFSYCETLSFAGHNDWRLPDINELQSFVDYTRFYPSIDTAYFPNTGLSAYWSSTTYADDPIYAWYVDFGRGYILFCPFGIRPIPYGGKSDYGYVRAVRGGQCGSFDTSTTTTLASTTTTTITGSTTTTVQPCPTETLYGEYSEQTELLRYLRDNVLTQAPEGQELIRLYYEWSPEIVQMMNEDEEFKAQVKEMIDIVVEMV